MENGFKSKWGDGVTGTLILILGIIGFVGSYSIKVAPGAGNISAQIMPRIISVIMVVLGFILAVKGLLSGIQINKQEKKEQQSERKQKNNTYYNGFLMDSMGIVIAIAIFVLYTLFIKQIGFVILTPLMIFIFELLLSPKEERKYIRFILVAMIATAIMYLFFMWDLVFSCRWDY